MSRPVAKKFKITCDYGVKGSSWSSGWHQGIDYGCPVGTPVFSPVAGKIVKNKRAWGGAFGNHQAIIKFRSTIDGKIYYLGLMHMTAETIPVGVSVGDGQRVGTSGAEGNVHGAHLHIEVQELNFWRRGKAVNPTSVIAGLKP